MAHASRACLHQAYNFNTKYWAFDNFLSLILYRRINYIKEFSTVLSVFRKMTFLKLIFPMLCRQWLCICEGAFILQLRWTIVTSQVAFRGRLHRPMLAASQSSEQCQLLPVHSYQHRLFTIKNTTMPSQSRRAGNVHWYSYTNVFQWLKFAIVSTTGQAAG